MITTLPKHHGRHAGLIAFAMFATAGVVVYVTRPREPRDAPRETPAVARAAAAVPVERTPERAPTVEREPAKQPTATGIAMYDERRTTHVYAPVNGWLQKTRPTALGRKVKQGETLAVIYSPEVWQASQELVAQVRDFRSQELLDAQRYRLLRWGMPWSDVARIEKTQTPQATLRLVARLAGTVVAEQGARGQLVEPSGIEYFTVTEPGFYWVLVEMRQIDTERLRVGTAAKLTIEGVSRPLPAKIAYMYRADREGMRTLRFDLYAPRTTIVPNAKVTAEFVPVK